MMGFKNVYKEHSKPKVYDVWDLRNRKFIFYLTVGGVDENRSLC